MSLGATTSARAVRECGAMNDTTKPSTPQAITGPPLARLYPVEPAGVAMARPSHRTRPTSSLPTA